MATENSQPEWASDIIERLARVETQLGNFVRQSAMREWYTTDQVAEILGKRPFTVREWCRLGRVNCQKKDSGRGKHPQWVIAHEEVLRIQRAGLLPRETISTVIDKTFLS